MLGLALFSLGLSALVAPITATALSSVPPDAAGIASGVNSTISRLGNLLAVAIIGLIVSVVFQPSGGNSNAVPLEPGQSAQLKQASSDAFRAGMIVTAALAFTAAAVAARWISNHDARAADAVPSEQLAHAVAGPKTTC